MSITRGLISLEEAKTSIFNGSSPGSVVDRDVEAYIEAATPVIEEITGPLLPKQVTYERDGGKSAILLPHSFTSVVSVLEDDVALSTTDYVARRDSGIIHAGGKKFPRRFVAGRMNIVATVTIGSSDPIPPNVKLAARELVRFWWQQGRQGNRPQLGAAPDTTPEVSSGFAVPRRVTELLRPHRRIGGIS